MKIRSNHLLSWNPGNPLEEARHHRRAVAASWPRPRPLSRRRLRKFKPPALPCLPFEKTFWRVYPSLTLSQFAQDPRSPSASSTSIDAANPWAVAPPPPTQPTTLGHSRCHRQQPRNIFASAIIGLTLGWHQPAAINAPPKSSKRCSLPHPPDGLGNHTLRRAWQMFEPGHTPFPRRPITKGGAPRPLPLPRRSCRLGRHCLLVE